MFAVILLWLCINECYASVKNCNKDSYIKLLGSSITPAFKGKTVNLNLTTISPSQISDGVVTYSTRYNYLPVFRYSEKLDTVLRGHYVKTIKYQIPEYAVGNIAVEIKWYSPLYGDLICVRIEENLWA
jgi:hypothetical protein